jgi:hypothetical protein
MHDALEVRATLQRRRRPSTAWPLRVPSEAGVRALRPALAWLRVRVLAVGEMAAQGARGAAEQRQHQQASERLLGSPLCLLLTRHARCVAAARKSRPLAAAPPSSPPDEEACNSRGAACCGAAPGTLQGADAHCAAFGPGRGVAEAQQGRRGVRINASGRRHAACGAERCGVLRVGAAVRAQQCSAGASACCAGRAPCAA